MSRPRRRIGWIAAALALIGSAAPAADENPLEPMGKYVGGQWVTRGDFRVRVVYEWGIEKKLLKAKSYLTRESGEKLVYESVFAYHPEKKAIIFLSVGGDGGIFDGTMTPKDGSFESVFTAFSAAGKGSTFRQVLQFRDDDTISWTVFARKGEEWTKVIDETQHREPLAAAAK